MVGLGGFKTLDDKNMCSDFDFQAQNGMEKFVTDVIFPLFQFDLSTQT